MRAVVERTKKSAKRVASATGGGESGCDRTEAEHAKYFAALQTHEQPNLRRVDEFERHPANRVPTADDVATVAESIRTIGQIDAIVARRRGDTPKLQILSGETRWLAMRTLGAVMISARVIECTDAQALALVVEANAKRTDLTTIQRAQLLRRLTSPVEEGGAGMPRDAAAKTFGIEPSTVSNLVKLLDAPAEWQRRLDTPDLDEHGDPVRIHQATVREIAKFAVVSRLATAMETAYQEDHVDEYADGLRGTRQNQLDWVHDVVRREVRFLDGSRRWVGNGYTSCSIDDFDPETVQQLDVHELPIGDGGTAIPVATNIELFDRLHQQALDRTKTPSAGRSPADGDASPAEQTRLARERKKKADQQLRTWADEWALRLLRSSMAEYLTDDEALWLAPWLLTHALCTGICRPHEFVEYAAEAIAARLRSSPKAKPTPGMVRVLETRSLARDAHAKQQADSRGEGLGFIKRCCQMLLWPSDPQSHRPKLIPTELPERLPYIDRDSLLAWSVDLAVTIEDAWHDGTTDGAVQRALISELLHRHNTEQLANLRDELCPEVVLPKGKAAAAAAILHEHKPGRPLPLPSIVALKAKRKMR